MNSATAGKATRSRVSTGFHRLGIALAVPLLVVAIWAAVASYFSTDGPAIPDPSATPPLTVLLATDPLDLLTQRQIAITRARIRSGRTENLARRFEVDTGPIRTFSLYWVDPAKSERPGEDLENSTLRSLFAFEAGRGTTLTQEEQPALIGNLLLHEDQSLRQRTYTKRTHLKRGYDWAPLWWGVAFAVAAVLIYILARTIGWIIDGFIAPGR